MKKINPRHIWLKIKNNCPHRVVIYRVGRDDECEYDPDDNQICCIEECPRLKG
jgi:hypothetical protein